MSNRMGIITENGYHTTDEDSALKFNNIIIPQLNPLWAGDTGLGNSSKTFNLGKAVAGKKLKIIICDGKKNEVGEYNIKCVDGEFHANSVLSYLNNAETSSTPSLLGKTIFSTSGNNLIIKQELYNMTTGNKTAYSGYEFVTAIYEVIE